MDKPTEPGTAESDAPTCGHTTAPCTDAQTWCHDCGAPPCCQHVATCDELRPCKGRNVNVCVAEGCYGEACVDLALRPTSPASTQAAR